MTPDKILGKLKVSDFFGKSSQFIHERSSWILFGIFLIAIGYCAFLWQQFVYSPNWDNEKKQAYISTKEKEAVFSRERFDAVISEIERRKSLGQEKIEGINDIFRIQN